MCKGLCSLDRLLFVLLLQTLQNHYHPEVAKAAAVLNRSLSEMEDDIAGLLELSAYEVGLLCVREWFELEERARALGTVAMSALLLGRNTGWLSGTQGQGRWENVH